MHQLKIADYSITDEIWRGPSLSFVAGQKIADQQNVVMEILVEENCQAKQSFEKIRQLFESKPLIIAPQAISPQSIVDTDQGPVIISGLPCGELLAKRCGKPIKLGKVINIAIIIAEALEKYHAAGLLHCQLSPARIWLDEANKAACFTGLHASSGCDGKMRDRDCDYIERECWPYVAPERLGLIEKLCDIRCDFYSLGAILFELISGKPAFKARTFLECFRAQVVLPTPEIIYANDDNSVPDKLTRLVRKLMEKKADDRYQSHKELSSDLYELYNDWLGCRSSENGLSGEEVPEMIIQRTSD